jgi:hypothetical protein
MVLWERGGRTNHADYSGERHTSKKDKLKSEAAVADGEK